MKELQHVDLANAVRALAMDAIELAGSGHPGLPLGAADIATVLFTRVLKHDPMDPHWPDRDRFVLSAGHGSMLLYAALHLSGYADFPINELRRFRQFGSNTAGHPEYGHGGGIETTTGPLGQGLANAVGMAIAEARLRAEFGIDLVGHHTFALVGDGCLMEGISQEAIALAGHLCLNRLIVIWDDNGITIDGSVSMADSTDQLARFQSSGWHTIAVDGHDDCALEKALLDARESDRPTLIAAKTIIGYGSPAKAGTAAAHGAPLGAADAQGTRLALGIDYPAFEVPEPVVAAWRTAGKRSAGQRREWQQRLQAHPQSESFLARQEGDVASVVADAIMARKATIAATWPALPGRQLSHDTLEVLNRHVTGMVGGSADLTPANQTATSTATAVQAGNPGGSYIHYGIREHGMAAVMNGIALHGGLIPYGGTFLVFSDYSRPAIRLAALMGIRVVHVMTHDSIALGADGPTHQPVEHLASLRLIPNLLVMRPADAIEVAECWQIALETRSAPSVLALSRQPLQPFRREATRFNLCQAGAYMLEGYEQGQAVIFASGSEVSIAVAAAKLLAADGIATRIVSVPCLELLSQQPTTYRTTITGTEKARVAVEAGVASSWQSLLGPAGRFIGMSGFGASGPAETIYEHFNITATAVAAAIRDQL